MRDFLYRGFCVDKSNAVSDVIINGDVYSGYWIYGFPLYSENDDLFLIDKYSGEVYSVIPETVTEYVGFVDRNENLLFDKDIVEDNVGRIMIVCWKNFAWCFYLLYVPDFKSHLSFDGYASVSQWDSDSFKILGNIWTLDVNVFVGRK